MQAWVRSTGHKYPTVTIFLEKIIFIKNYQLFLFKNRKIHNNTRNYAEKYNKTFIKNIFSFSKLKINEYDSPNDNKIDYKT